MKKALIIQTAFAGDMILTTPLIGECKRLLKCEELHVLCIPSTQGLLAGNPDVDRIIVYDKRRRQPSLPALMWQLHAERYDICLSPHRSFRSALLAFSSGARKRAAFDRSAGRFLYTDIIQYKQQDHEVVRNLSLLEPFTDAVDYTTVPILFPTERDGAAVAGFMHRPDFGQGYVCIAPGSVWATKRWLPAGFAEVANALTQRYAVVLIGGADDVALCTEIHAQTDTARCFNAAGKFSFLETASLVQNAELLISNDSAPVHIASAVSTPVVDIFGATVPEFGFGPLGVPHKIVQRADLSCKPCGIHGGNSCPIKTFECMRQITAADVLDAVESLLPAVRRHEN